MSYRIGDSVFLSKGEPTVAVARNMKKGTLILDRDTQAVEANSRHGYINGLPTERRQEFLSIMDEVKRHPEAAMRVEELQKRIDELEVDPKNMLFVNYLESEKNHLINMSGYKPRIYATEEFKLR